MPLHGNTPYTLALALPLSKVRDFYDSRAFSDYRKAQEAQNKLTNAFLQRIDGVIKAIGALGKAIVMRR